MESTMPLAMGEWDMAGRLGRINMSRVAKNGEMNAPAAFCLRARAKGHSVEIEHNRRKVQDEV
jgi:hypothetical protein